MSTKVRTLSLLFSTAFLATSHAQNGQLTTSAPPEDGLTPTEQTIKDIKQPLSWMTWGTDLRIRNEYFNDLLTLSPSNPLHEQDYFRFRARVWTSITPVENITFNTRLATEPREWMRPAGYTIYKGQSGLDMSEGVVDNLNLQWKNILGLPLTAVVGRQDLFLGDGWLLGDGTPYDGSWTYYLDSARVTCELKDQHTIIETIGIIQDAKDNGWMPTIGDQDRYLTEQNEKGAILSIGNSSLKSANAAAYFIYKHDDKVSGFNAQTPPPRGGDNADIYTLGGRLNGLLGEHWKYWTEGAYQFGQKQDSTVQYPAPSTQFRTIDAFGVNSKLSYMVKDRLNNQFMFSYEFLTGDDPKTGNDEMFDVLWGRWPHWSEVGLYSYAAETRVGQQANLQRFGPGWSIDPGLGMTFSVNYFALFSEQEVATRGVSGLFSNSGSFRGHFFQAVLKYNFSRHVSGHLWGEVLFPGDYYLSHAAMPFLRAEVAMTF